MMKNRGGERDDRRHSRETANEKVNRNFPCPDRRFNNWLTVVTGSATGRTRRGELARNRPTCNIDTAPGNDAVFPGLLAQLFEPFFGWRCHEKSVNARSAAMNDAIAVAIADVHADFR